MKKTISGFINYKPGCYRGEADFKFHSCEMQECGFVTVMPYSIEVDIPDDFDPRAEQVRLLKAEKIKLMAEFQARCTAIEKQISQLTALTCEVTA